MALLLAKKRETETEGEREQIVRRRELKTFIMRTAAKKKPFSIKSKDQRWIRENVIEE